MGISKVKPGKIMLNDGTGNSTVHAGVGGWYRTHANGQEELIQCMSGVKYDKPKKKKVSKPAKKQPVSKKAVKSKSSSSKEK